MSPTSADLLNAVGLMDEYELDHEGALHLAVALGAGEVVANDRDFDRKPLARRFERAVGVQARGRGALRLRGLRLEREL